MANKVSAWLGAHKPTKRRLIQVYAALLFNANLKGFIQGEIYTGPTKNVCIPGFNCYSCPGAVGACPLGALQNALASSGARAPYYVLGILMLYGVILGRTICGWLCPLGLIQELFHKIPTPKIQKNRFTKVLSWLKYVVLAVFVVAIPLLYSGQHFPVPGFCKYICPAGTFEGAMALLANPVNAAKFSILNILFTRKFIIMVIILTACVFIYRAFCRFLCPLGAIYGLFARLSVLGVKVEASKCTHCQRCVTHCKVDIRRVGDHECIHCGACIDVCPTGAISLKCGKITLMANETCKKDPEKAGADKKLRKAHSIIAWIVALAVLAGALWYFNRPVEPPAVPAAATSESTPAQDAGQTQGDAQGTAPVGNEPGMLCPSFTVPLYGEGKGSFALSPGKVTVLNFWATWCTPCVGELPHFQKLHDSYADQISLVALHSNLVTDNVEEFLAREGFTFPFALDETGDVIKMLGGSTMLPMTVIVDKNGMITYNKVGSVTYEMLESLITPLL
ncbi:MAG: redoxin family protein [Clostridia bacterium]